MSKKRDQDLKSQNRAHLERRTTGSQVSQSTIQHRDIEDESGAVTSDSNPVSQDMKNSRNQAIKTNRE